MILLDEEDQPPSKLSPVAGSTLRLPDRASVASARTTSLPDYETSQAQHQLLIPKPKPPLHPKNDRRFWRATLYAFVIYVALSVVIGVPLIVTQLKKRKAFHGGPPPFDDPPSSNNANSNTPGVFAMGDPAKCLWMDTDDLHSQSLYMASSSFTLDATGSFLIRSNITVSSPEDQLRISGNFTVDINPDPSVRDAVFVVSLKTSNPSLRQMSHVCFCDFGSERGLSLYVPDDVPKSDSLSFFITLLFPQNSSILSIANLATTLPMFSHSLGDLNGRVTFVKVTLEGSSQEIACDSLQANQIVIRNALSSISGTFNVTERLILDTIGGSIVAGITVVNNQARRPPTVFSLDTGSGEIRANVTLMGPAETLDHWTGFAGLVKTFNAPVSLDVAHHSSSTSAPLDLRVYNSQAETNVTLDDKYSGGFDVSTKLAKAVVDEGKSASTSASSGSGQQRKFMYDESTPTRTRGWVGWGDRPPHWMPGRTGRVEVSSTLSPVLLHLGAGT